jgi:hypothetical protein
MTVNIPLLPIATRESNIFTNHFQNSLLSVGQLCDNGCEVNFLAQNATLKLHGDTLLVAQYEHATGIWRVNLTVSTPKLKPAPHEMYNV